MKKKVLLLIVLLGFTVIPGFGVENRIFTKYRSNGMDDPLLPKVDYSKLSNKIPEQAETYYTIREALKDPMVSRVYIITEKKKLDQDPEGDPPPKFESLEDMSGIILQAMTNGEYAAAVSMSERALNSLKYYERIPGISKNKLLLYRRTFIQSRIEATQKLDEISALNIFTSKAISVSGVIMDEKGALALIGNNAYSVGQNIKGLTITDITETAVTFTMKHKGKLYSWSIDL